LLVSCYFVFVYRSFSGKVAMPAAAPTRHTGGTT